MLGKHGQSLRARTPQLGQSVHGQLLNAELPTCSSLLEAGRKPVFDPTYFIFFSVALVPPVRQMHLCWGFLPPAAERDCGSISWCWAVGLGTCLGAGSAGAEQDLLCLLWLEQD